MSWRPRSIALATLGLSLLAALPAANATNLSLGRHLAGECVACHRRDAHVSGIPSIIGWPPDQFVAVLQSYKARERNNPAMQSVAGSLSDEEMAALAAYFATLKSAR